MLDTISFSSSWGSASSDAPVYASTIKLRIPGSKDPPEYYSVDVSKRLMDENGPSLESLTDWVARSLGVKDSQSLCLQYIDTEGDVVVLTRGGNEALALALMQYAQKSLKITAVQLDQENEKKKIIPHNVQSELGSGTNEEILRASKVHVKTTTCPTIRLKYKGQSIYFNEGDLYDKTKRAFCYKKLLMKLKCNFSSPGQILLFYSSETKTIPCLIRDDQDLQTFIDRHYKNPDLDMIAQDNPSILSRFILLVGVFSLMFTFASVHFANLTETDATPYAEEKNGSHECIESDEAKMRLHEVHLSPLNATILGSYAHMRSNPRPHVLFFHKTNRAMWELPNDDLIPGRYLVTAHVSRKSGATSLHLGATTADELTAYEYREMFMNVNQVNPTGSWSNFDQRCLGEVVLSGIEGEKFVLVANSKTPNIDFQDISLTRLGPIEA